MRPLALVPAIFLLGVAAGVLSVLSVVSRYLAHHDDGYDLANTRN